MNVQIITLRQGEGPDTPKNGDIVTVDVTVWEFDYRESENNYKGNRIIDKKNLVFVVGNPFPEGMHPVNQTYPSVLVLTFVTKKGLGRLNVLHEQVQDMFIKGQTRLTIIHSESDGSEPDYIVEATLQDVNFLIDGEYDIESGNGAGQ
ncbi:hypothetical protein GP486_005159 [Trichoglossum hirsutum]|uniref:Uncharacterized protein n=1 Tax=Trichoglossum hirsutum TaxID=265104 RepID=A0A9P8RN83_9PEZI|nr:hypothetical protein GP486_005159 [Trichoglossum hirsutum]